MAFATIVTSAESEVNTNETSHTVDMPSGVVSGDLLMVFFSCDGAESVGWPTGGDLWNEISEASSTGGNSTLAVAWRVSDGTEGASITVTTGTIEKSTHVVARINGNEDPTTQPPEVSTVEPIGTATTVDCPSLTPTGGAKDYLWLACGAWDGTDNAYISSPTNYALVQEIQNPSGGGRSHIAVAERDLNASVEDPGVFTFTIAEQRQAQTVVVHPAAAASPTSEREWEHISRVGQAINRAATF